MCLDQTKNMMKIIGLPALSDNYIWIIRSELAEWQNQAWVVDPGEAKVVIDYLKQNQLQLAGILITHHHYDHVDGVHALVREFGQNLAVIGSKGNFSAINHFVTEGDQVCLLGETFEILATPGHTSEHICFLHPQALFAGDTLFTAGCGRCFSGDYAAFAASLLKLKHKATEGCQLYCGHEYTWANIHFAAIAEPDNRKISQRLEQTRQTLLQNHACVPADMALELATNPFLRFDQPPLKTRLLHRLNQTEASNAALFKALRDWKDELDQTNLLEPALSEAQT